MGSPHPEVSSLYLVLSCRSPPDISHNTEALSRIVNQACPLQPLSNMHCGQLVISGFILSSFWFQAFVLWWTATSNEDLRAINVL
jgi:hypothetical protein